MRTDTRRRPAFDLTHHAESRLRQRGMSPDVARLVVENHDIAVPVGRGCVALSLSRAALPGLLADGLPPGLADKARRVAVVVEDATGLVVTVMHLHGDAARRYTRAGGRQGRRSRPERHPLTGEARR